MIRALVATAACLAAGPGQAAQFNFCWLGAGGYSLTGVIAFPDALLSAPMITEADVTRFEITGYAFGVQIGAWDIATRARSATWHLRFDPQTLTFPTGGSFGSDASQGWNASGTVDDCGRAGFGFNSGNYAQDICLYGVYVVQSSIDPTTPLRATTDEVSPNCQGRPLSG